MENKLELTTKEKEIINRNTEIQHSNHPKAVKCEQNIIKEGEYTINVNNYYMNLTDKQYMHFVRVMFKKLNTIHNREKTMNELIAEKIAERYAEKYGDPYRNITVAEVAEDLKMGENLANQLFRRKDFPSVNIGKTKTVCALAYIVWKMQHRESEVNVNE